MAQQNIALILHNTNLTFGHVAYAHACSKLKTRAKERGLISRFTPTVSMYPSGISNCGIHWLKKCEYNNREATGKIPLLAEKNRKWGCELWKKRSFPGFLPLRFWSDVPLLRFLSTLCLIGQMSESENGDFEKEISLVHKSSSRSWEKW